MTKGLVKPLSTTTSFVHGFKCIQPISVHRTEYIGACSIVYWVAEQTCRGIGLAVSSVKVIPRAAARILFSTLYILACIEYNPSFHFSLAEQVQFCNLADALLRRYLVFVVGALPSRTPNIPGGRCPTEPPHPGELRPSYPLHLGRLALHTPRGLGQRSQNPFIR